MARRGSPTAARTPSCASIRRPRRAHMAAAREAADANLNTLTFDRNGVALVHRPEWLVRPARSGAPARSRSGTRRAERALRHHATPAGDVYYASLAGNYHRAHRHRYRQGYGDRAADAAPGRAARVVRFARPGLGELLEHGPGRHVRPARRRGANGKLPGTGRRPMRCGSMMDKVWLTDWSAQRHRALRSRLPKSSRAFRRTAPGHACARCRAAPARHGALNRATTGW